MWGTCCTSCTEGTAKHYPPELPLPAQCSRSVPHQCYHVFLDVGSNIGEHMSNCTSLHPINQNCLLLFIKNDMILIYFILYNQQWTFTGIHARFLYEPDRYPESKSSVKAFANGFGYPRDNWDYCVFSFEPDPKFKQRHLDLEKAYCHGWVHVYWFVLHDSSFIMDICLLMTNLFDAQMYEIMPWT